MTVLCMALWFLACAVYVDFRMISGVGMSISPAVLYLVCGPNKIQFPRVAQSSKPDVTFHSFAMFICEGKISLHCIIMNLLFTIRG